MTTWGKKALKYLEDTDSGVFLGCETHLTDKEIETARGEARIRGWRGEFAPAAPTVKGGSSGGAVVLARKHLACQPLDPGLKPKGRDWVAMGIVVKGFRLILVSAYLSDDNSPTAVSLGNLAKLHEIMCFLKRSGCPFLIGADWNMLGAILAGLSWLDDISADIVSASQLDFTCTSGTGRTLDYFVASRQIIPLFQDVGRDSAAAWKPHIGLQLTISGTPKAISIRKYVEPEKFAEGLLPTNWARAFEESKASIDQEGIPGKRKAIKNEDLISKMYGLWSDGASKSASTWAMAAEKSMAVEGRHVRGQYQVVKLTTLVPKKSMEAWSKGAAETFWEQTTGMLAELKLLVGRGRGTISKATGGSHVADICSRLIGNLDRFKDLLPGYTSDLEDKWRFYLSCGLAQTAGDVSVQITAPLGQAAAASAGPDRSDGDEDDWFHEEVEESNEAHYQHFMPEPDMDAPFIENEGPQECPDTAPKEPGNTIRGPADTLEVGNIEALWLDAQNYLARTRQAAKKNSYANFRTWAFRAVSKGASAAHTWSKSSGGIKYLTMEGTDKDGSFVADPLGMMGIRKDFWSSLWRKEASPEGDRNELISVLGLVRAAGLEQAEGLERLQAEDIGKAVAKLSNKPTRWADSWTNSELKLIVNSSEEAKAELVNVYNVVETTCALPHQAAVATVGLITKPGAATAISTGERPICIFSCFFQLWGLLRAGLNSTWEAERAGFWDTAIAGSSALTTGLLRALLDEVAAVNGIAAASIYYDMEKFYDNISLVVLCRLALKLVYPALPLALSVQAYLGGRRLRADGCLSDEVHPSNSLGAGCRRANTFSRIMLYELLDFAHKRHPLVRSYQFVDDLVQRCEGTPHSIGVFLAPAAAALLKGIDELKCIVSKVKTKIGGHPAAARNVSLELKRLGFDIGIEDEVKDLGIGQSYRRHRRTKQQYKRLTLGLTRVARIAKLKFTRQAKKLVNTGAIPAACYGAACGWPPRKLNQVRAAMAKVLPGGKQSSCVTSTIAISAKKAFDDPGTRLPVTTILNWVGIWYKLPEGRRAPVRLAWNKVYNQMAERRPNQRWAKACGPMSAAVVTLMELDWSPASPDCWRDHEDAEWTLCKGFSSSDLKHMLSAAAERKNWARACRLHNGSGLQDGADLTAWNQEYGNLIKSNRLAEAGMLATIGSGGFWSPARRAAAGLAVHVGCWRCGAPGPLADDLHIFWTCPTFRASTNEHIKASQHLAAKAVQGNNPCFWLRGLLPKALTKVDFSTPKTVYLEFGPSVHSQAVTDGFKLPGHLAGRFVAVPGSRPREIVIATDGSGGEFTADRRLRSCGWGICWVNVGSTVEAIYGFAGALPFSIQTVPLAELFALYQALVWSPEADLLHIFADASYVVDNFKKGRQHCLAHVSHSSVWLMVFDLVADLLVRGTRVEVTKVKAHNEQGITSEVAAQTFGNIVADKLAETAARYNHNFNMCRVSAAALGVAELDSMASLVVKRLAQIGLENARDLGTRMPSRKRGSGPKDHGGASGLPVRIGPSGTRALPCEDTLSDRRPVESSPCCGSFPEASSGSGDRPSYVEVPVSCLPGFPGPPDPQVEVAGEDLAPAPNLEVQEVLIHIPAEAAEIAQPGLASARGYNDFGGNRKEWARRVALDVLSGRGHNFAPADVINVGGAVRCLDCLLDFSASRIAGLSKTDGGCGGKLLIVGPGPLLVPQVWVSPGGGGLTLKGIEFDPSHKLRHFAGAVWCSVCGGILNVLRPASKSGAPLLSRTCKLAPSSKPYRFGLEQISRLECPSHLAGGWPGASNLRLKGFA